MASHAARVKPADANAIAREVVVSLALARQKKGLSYEDMAGQTGLHATSISLIERQKRQPTFVNLVRMAEAMGLRLSRLVSQAERAVRAD